MMRQRRRKYSDDGPHNPLYRQSISWRERPSSDILRCSVPLYNFVSRDRFMNSGENYVCPADGMSMLTTLQGRGDVGTQMASADVDLAALDDMNAVINQIARIVRVHLQSISGTAYLQKEIVTKVYIIDRLFGPQRSLISGFIEELVPFIDNKYEDFKRQVSSTASCATFASDVSRVGARYYNTCITASSNEGIGHPGTVTPVSF